jgi:hypothetical protein
MWLVESNPFSTQVPSLEQSLASSLSDIVLGHPSLEIYKFMKKFIKFTSS